MAGAHDARVAAISHLPLVVSAALVEAVAGRAPNRAATGGAAALAAGGWDAMTRLARGDATMGAGIAATNAPAIAARLRDLRGVLDEWLALLEAAGGPDEPALRARFAAARDAARGRRLMGDPDERVLVVPRASIVPGRRLARRPRRDGIEAALEAVARDGLLHAPGDARRDPTHKQVIPYLVLRDGERWFLMRRTRAGGDARLHDLWSIGVGGHLNPGDGDVAGGLRREWAEELVADFEPRFEPVGLLNDDTTPVGAVARRASSTSRTPRDGRSPSARPTS